MSEARISMYVVVDAAGDTVAEFEEHRREEAIEFAQSAGGCAVRRDDYFRDASYPIWPDDRG